MLKKIMVSMLALIWLPVLLWTQPATSVAEGTAEYFLSGEHYPVIYTGQGTINGAADPCTTSWVQVGYSPNAAASANRNIGRFNPEFFTVALKLACAGAGDSAKVSNARFETAYDTTVAGIWNADSSNIYISDGYFSHNDYGVWRFETLSDTSRSWSYPLRALVGGYVRLILASDLADTCTVDWSLIGEH